MSQDVEVRVFSTAPSKNAGLLSARLFFMSFSTVRGVSLKDYSLVVPGAWQAEMAKRTQPIVAAIETVCAKRPGIHGRSGIFFHASGLEGGRGRLALWSGAGDSALNRAGYLLFANETQVQTYVLLDLLSLHPHLSRIGE